MKKKQKDSVEINQCRLDYYVEVERLACYMFFGSRGTRKKSREKLRKILFDEGERQNKAEEELANAIVGYDGQRPVTFSEALDNYDFKDNKPGYRYTKKPTKKPAKSTFVAKRRKQKKV
jgi:hypothetical protein